MSLKESEYQQLLGKAKEKILRYREELSLLRQSKNELIAVIGIACQFPGAVDSHQYWQNLLNSKISLHNLKTQNRWPYDYFASSVMGERGKIYAPSAGLLESIDQFDAELFKLSPREIEDMDPQHRLLLMLSWILFEDAGYAPLALPTPDVGVFIGIMNQEYAHLLKGLQAITEYTGTGSAFSVAAGRLSYTFGLQGPCFAIDTACSSSLIAIHQACQSLRMQECRMAIAGGVNLLLSPDAFIGSCQARMLSPTGQCRPFDNQANGYVRSEGAGLVLLKPLTQAEAEGDRIYAVIQGSAVNHDGHSQGLTVPNVNAQIMVMNQALYAAQLSPDQINFIEAHGTGTSLGDPIEAESIQTVYGRTLRKQSLQVSSVKANIGHTESAAGVAGFIKVVLSLYYRCFPAQPAIDIVNTLCPFTPGQINISKETTYYPDMQHTIYGAVSAFSFSGSNAHMILRDYYPTNPANSLSSEENQLTKPVELLVLSAASVSSLKKLQNAYYHAIQTSEASLTSISVTSQQARSHLPFRKAFIANSKADLCKQLVEDTATPKAAIHTAEINYDFTLPEATHLIFQLQMIDAELKHFLSYQKQRQRVDHYLLESRGLTYTQWLECGEIIQSYADDVLTLIITIMIQNSCADLWCDWGMKPTKLWITNYYSLLSALVFSRVLSWKDLLTGVALSQSGFQQWLQNRIKIQWKQAIYKIYAEDAQPIALTHVLDLIKQNQWQIKQHNFFNNTTFNINLFGSKLNRLTALKACYLGGCQIHWEKLYSPNTVKKCDLPTYTFDLKSYWIPPTRLRRYNEALINSVDSNKNEFAALGIKLDLPGKTLYFKQTINTQTMPFLKEHKVHEQIVFPAAAYLMMAFSLSHYLKMNYSLKAMRFLQPLRITTHEHTLITRYVPHKISGGFEISSKCDALDSPYINHVMGKLILNKHQQWPPWFKTIEQPLFQYSVEMFYRELKSAGLAYGASFQRLEAIYYDDKSVLGKFLLAETTEKTDDFARMTVFLDIGFQLIGILNKQDGIQDVYVPAEIATMTLYQRLEDISQVLIKKDEQARDAHKPATLSFNIVYLDKNQIPVLAITAFRISRFTFDRWLDKEMLYDVAWTPINSALNTVSLTRIKADQLALMSAFAAIQNSIDAQAWFNALNEFLPIAAVQILQRCHLWPADTDRITANQIDNITKQNKVNACLLSTLFSILLEHGFLLKEDNDFKIISNELYKLDQLDLVNKGHQLKTQYPQHAAETHLLFHCLTSLPEVIGGQKKYTQVLFDEQAGLSEIYINAQGAKILNQQIATAINTCLNVIDSSLTLTILEIGAGTGATTKVILDEINAASVHYIFSDISPNLITQAKAKFADYSNISFARIDASHDLSQQGIAPDSIDIVIIANALHATPDIFQSLSHIKKVLKNSGILLMRELVQPAHWLNLIFGLTPEWWNADDNLREGQPLLSISNWKQVLAQTGFEQLEILSESDTVSEVVFLAKKSYQKALEYQQAVLMMAEQAHVELKPYVNWIQQQDTTRLITLEDLNSQLIHCSTPIHIIYFMPDISANVQPASVYIEQIMELCRAIFRLIQITILSGRWLKDICIILIAYNCFTILPGEIPDNFALALCQGFIKSLAHEHADLVIKLVELTAGVSKECFYQAVLNTTEPIVACRNECIYIQQLTHHAWRVPKRMVKEASHLGSYLIAGGLGGLGKIVTQWFLERGVKHIILIGRSSDNQQIQNYCQSLSERYAAQVAYFSVDMTDEAQVKLFVQMISQWPPVKGVIDGVGVLQDGVIFQQDWQSYKKVLYTKIAAAWLLHNYFGQSEDFILFSSAAALFGSAGQTNHSAANAYLDSLAVYRRAKGLQAIAINWGAWSKIGAAFERNVEQKFLLNNVGVEMIAPEKGMAAFAYIYQSRLIQIGVLPLDWAKYSYHVPMRLKHYLANLLPKKIDTHVEITDPNVPHTQQISWKILLENKLSSRRQRFCMELIESEIKKLLHFGEEKVIEPETHFFDLGMDSLTALALLDILKVKFDDPQMPTTLIFNYPNLFLLAKYLLSHYVEKNMVLV